MRRAQSLLLPLFALLWATTPSVDAQQFPTHTRLQEAYLAWDRGAYDEALEGYLAVLTGAGGAQHVGEIALLTGELYQVDELAVDGRSGLRLGPDGRFVAFQFEEGNRAVTRIVDLAQSGRTVATLDAAVLALLDGAVAYLPPGVTGEVRIRTLPDGPERTVELQGWSVGASATSVAGALVASPEGDALYVLAGRDPQNPASDVLRISNGAVSVLGTGAGRKSALLPAAGGRHLVFTATPVGEGGGGGRGGAAGGAGGAAAELVVLDVASGQALRFPARSGATLSADGSTLAFIGRDGAAYLVEAVRLGDESAGTPALVTRTTMEVTNPALSPSGATVAFQGRPVHDWEVFAAPTTEGAAVRQLTREIQHDINPRFLDERTVLALKGEARHRRSYLYDAETGRETKLFHNNTVRTIAPEYEWQVSPDGRKVLILADRDGDTISRERGVYVVHLDRTVTADALRRRLEENLAGERDLRARGVATFGPIRDRVAAVTEQIDPARIYQYARTLYEMDSKHINQPGNQLAIAYLEAQLREWGYEPEVQWFETQVGQGGQARTVRTANVIARLLGTTNPELVYVVSSHFDSVEQGPGADDNSSGSTALLEAARVLQGQPQPATLEFAFFTAEEAGLRGSREYVRRAVADGKRIVGALNNDMIGFANDHRLDNTIRYSNPGIRDIQHNAAMLFSDLITYDALYYQSTDAAAYYEAYGDIVGGIGSYPVLGNPHYHQRTDRLETISMQLVAEVSRTTVATLMLLASSPSRLADVQARSVGGGAVELSWASAPEGGVSRYRVSYQSGSGQTVERELAPAGGARQTLRLEGVAPGSTIAVKAANQLGMDGWDWARTEAPR